MASSTFARIARQAPFHDEGYGYDVFGLHPPRARERGRAGAPLYERYFRVDSHGIEHIPAEGPAILVANHAGVLPVDGAMLCLDVLRAPTRRGSRARSPTTSSRGCRWSARCSRASAWSAARARTSRACSSAASSLAIWPEGVTGPAKRFRDRYRLQSWRVGFAELAIRHRAPSSRSRSSVPRRAGRSRRSCACVRVRGAVPRRSLRRRCRCRRTTTSGTARRSSSTATPAADADDPASRRRRPPARARRARAHDRRLHAIGAQRSVPMRVMVTGATRRSARRSSIACSPSREVELVLAVGREPQARVPRARARLSRGRSDARARAPRSRVGRSARPRDRRRSSTACSIARARSRHRVHAQNVDATRSARAAPHHPTIRRFVYRSFAEVYAPALRRPNLLDEDAPLDFDPTAPQWVRDRVEADLTVCAHLGARTRDRRAALRRDPRARHRQSALGLPVVARVPAPARASIRCSTCCRSTMRRRRSARPCDARDRRVQHPGPDTLPLSRAIARATASTSRCPAR